MLRYILWTIAFVGTVNCEVITVEESKSSFCSTEDGNYTFFHHTNFTYRIKEGSLCNGDVYLLNYVQSSSDHFERRLLIRRTFGSLKLIHSVHVKLVFVVGLPRHFTIQPLIEKESENYRDIVQANFQDTYRNLTLKHIVALHWIYNFCPQAKYITKSDDDTFVNNFSLLDYLKETVPTTDKFILGPIQSTDFPVRDSKSKWFVTKSVYKAEHYPPYIRGAGYLMSQAAIEPLLVCSYYNRFLFVDDVFITGIVSRSGNVTLQNTDLAIFFSDLIKEKVTTDIMNNIFMIGDNKVNVNTWIDVWKVVTKLF